MSKPTWDLSLSDRRRLALEDLRIEAERLGGLEVPPITFGNVIMRWADATPEGVYALGDVVIRRLHETGGIL